MDQSLLPNALCRNLVHRKWQLASAYIPPGSPLGESFVESFNGGSGMKFLNLEIFLIGPMKPRSCGKAPEME